MGSCKAPRTKPRSGVRMQPTAPAVGRVEIDQPQRGERPRQETRWQTHDSNQTVFLIRIFCQQNSGETLPRPARIRKLQRAQEVQNLLLLISVEVAEILLDCGGFAAMAGVRRDSRVQVGGAAIVQQEDPLPQSPQGRCAELIAARAPLRDVVRQAAAHVMYFDIRERRHWSIAQRGNQVRHLGRARRRIVAG